MHPPFVAEGGVENESLDVTAKWVVIREGLDDAI
jgi:hypothetical protein